MIVFDVNYVVRLTSIEDTEDDLREIGSFRQSENIVPVNDEPIILVVLFDSSDWSEILSNSLSKNPLALIIIPSRFPQDRK